MPYYQDAYGNVYQQPEPAQTRQSPVYPDWWPSNQRNQNTQSRQPIQPTTLPGRFVKSEDDISPQEIPMDNSIAVFPLSDFSAVLLKKWENNGTITTVPYEPRIVPQGPTPEQQFQSDIQQRLGKMEDMLGVLMNIWQPTQSKDDKEEKK